MFKVTAICAAVLAAGQSWASTQCDPAEAEGILEYTQASGIVAGMNMHDGIPPISVEGEAWVAINLETGLASSARSSARWPAEATSSPKCS